MQRFRKYFRATILLLILGLCIRLVYVASQCELGAETLLRITMHSTIDWLRGRQTEFGARHPSIQADYWLEESKRILESNSDDARVAMGGALVMDEPDTKFMSREWIKRGDPYSQYFETGASTFEKRCRERCRELAARATAIEPENKEWWRLRALLLEQEYSATSPPFDADRIALLEECASHDPGNALYDYIAADYLWNQSAKIEYPAFLNISDESLFQHGVTCYEHGQEKPFIAFGQSESASLDFLAESDLWLKDHTSLVTFRSIYRRKIGLVRGIWDWQHARGEMSIREGNVRHAIELYEQNLRVVQQVEATDSDTSVEVMLLNSRVATDWTLVMTAREHPDEFSTEEIERFTAQLIDAKSADSIDEEARRQVFSSDWRSTIHPVLPYLFPLILAITLPLFAMLFTLSLPGWLIKRFFKSRTENNDTTTIGFWWQISSFVVALAISLFLFAIAPSEWISDSVQTWIFSLCILVFVCSTLAVICFKTLRKRSFRVSLKGIFITVTVLCIVFGLFGTAILDVLQFGGFVELSIPPGEEVELPGFLMLNGVVSCIRDDHWLYYHGEYWAIAFWAVLLALIVFRKCGNAIAKDAGIGKRWLTRFSHAFSAISVSFFRLAILLLIVWLAIMPTTIRILETDRQHTLNDIRDPLNYSRQVNEIVDSMRSDESTMKDYRDWAADEVEAEFAEELTDEE